jgi:hypothetical protein
LLRVKAIAARIATEKGIFTVAVEFKPESLLLLPAGMAIWFMLWALWHWWKEEKR